MWRFWVARASCGAWGWQMDSGMETRRAASRPAGAWGRDDSWVVGDHWGSLLLGQPVRMCDVWVTARRFGPRKSVGAVHAVAGPRRLAGRAPCERAETGGADCSLEAPSSHD